MKKQPILTGIIALPQHPCFRKKKVGYNLVFNTINGEMILVTIYEFIALTEQIESKHNQISKIFYHPN